MGNEFWNGWESGKVNYDGTTEDQGAIARKEHEAKKAEYEKELNKQINGMISPLKEPNYSSSGGCASVIAILIMLYVLI